MEKGILVKIPYDYGQVSIQGFEYEIRNILDKTIERIKKSMIDRQYNVKESQSNDSYIVLEIQPKAKAVLMEKWKKGKKLRF